MVHVVLPSSVDDPRRPSGGNVYDRRVLDGLVAAGERVDEHPVTGAWPDPAPDELTDLAGILARIPDDAVVLIDGLVATAAPAQLSAEADRMRLVPLLHLVTDAVAPDPAEAAVLAVASAVLTTSRWTRDRLSALHDLTGTTVHVCEPGTDPARTTAPSPGGGRLLSIGAVTPTKCHDVLLRALATLPDLDWSWTCVGPLDRDPTHVMALRQCIDEAGLTARATLTGPLDRAGVDACLARADLLVHPSREEAYGMVITEALARGVPVLATTAGGLPAALGTTPTGDVPGMLVPPGERSALVMELQHWLEDSSVRERLRAAARERRMTLPTWQGTIDCVAAALAQVREVGRARV